jgi:uroporphyrinogen-III decarboxylase
MLCATGTGKITQLRSSPYDVIGLDWGMDMAVARKTLGPDATLQVGIKDPDTFLLLKSSSSFGLAMSVANCHKTGLC